MSKPGLIILHGALGCKTQFTEWESALSGKYDCYCFDLPGHGNRSNEDVTFSIKLFAEELKKFINEKKVKKPAVLGYSMGGYVALYTALYTRNLLGNIMTVATKFDWSLESSKKEAGYLQPQLMQEKVPQLAEQLKQRHGSHWGSVVNKTAEMMLLLGAEPLLTSDNIKTISEKIKLCVGDKDKMVSVTETLCMYRNALNSCFCVLPDTGHLPESIAVERIKFEAEEFFLS
jgi:pimeloyl-ACP methyl ester carboxylesterase